MPGEHPKRGRVLRQRLAADPEDRDPGRAHVAVGVHGHGAEVDERAGLDDRPARADEAERLGERLGAAGAIDDDVGAEPARRLSHLAAALLGGRRRRVERRVGAERPGMLEPLGQHVDRDQPPGAEHLGLRQVHQAQRPDSQHEHRVAEAEGRVEAVGHGHHLGQRGDLRRQLVRDAEEARPRQQVHALGPAAEEVGRLGAGERVPVVVQGGAQVVGRDAVEAEAAPPARQVGRGDDAVTGGERSAELVDAAGRRARSPRSRRRSRGRR